MKVKGSMLMFVVKGIRAAGVEHFDHLLTDQERALVGQRILPINWYPFASYRLLFDALVTVVARGNMRMVRQWGRDYGSIIMGDVYRSVILEGNPFQSLKNHERRFSSFYDFGSIQVASAGTEAAELTVGDFDPSWEAIYHMIAGWLERTVELAGGRNPKVDLTARSWDGAPATVYKVSWTGA
jgi:uncharacterized protein (TIGR02265 family)